MKKKASVAIGVSSQKGKTTVKYNSSSKGSAVAVKAGAIRGNIKSHGKEVIW
jgi:hypothetical protein